MPNIAFPFAFRLQYDYELVATPLHEYYGAPCRQRNEG